MVSYKSPAPQQVGSPDSRLLLAQALSQSPERPIRTFGGGLSQMAERLLNAYTAKQAQDEVKGEKSAAQKALVEGLTAKPWVNPDTGQVAPGTEPGLSMAARLLGGMEDNPYAADLSADLMTRQAMQQAEIEQQKQLAEANKAGTTRTINRDGDQVTQEYRGGQWIDIATAPRWQPDKPPAPPSSVQEYEFAKSQGFTGSFADWKAANKSGTNISINQGTPVPEYSKAPQGFVYLRTPEGQIRIDEQGLPMMAPIPGTEQERERTAAAEAKSEKEAQEKRYGDVVVEDIDRVIKKVQEATIPATGAGSLLSGIPGTPARDVAALVDTIKANIGFDRLQQMRDNSPTGGALGQVSEFENRLLQATLGNLELSQSEEQFTDNLKRVRELYLDIVHGPGNRPGQADGDAPKATGFGTVDDVQSKSVEDLRAFVEGADDATLNALPDDVADAIAAKLRGQ